MTQQKSSAITVARRKPVPLKVASGPAEYTPGQQEPNIELSSLADMLR